jgi:type IV pilus assembly protein PilE
MSPRNSLKSGWSLLELLMVLGLMGLCASLAWPSYQALMQRSQRAQARVLLMQTAHWLERSAAVQGSYPLVLPSSVWQQEGLNYQLSLVSDGVHYVLTASPWRQQAGDACGSFTLSDTGARGVRDARISVADCWSP